MTDREDLSQAANALHLRDTEVHGMTKKKGVMIAGAVMLTEGVVLAVWGRRYLELMESEGLMDVGKRIVRRLDIRSPRAFAAIGLAEAVFGLMMLRRAQASS